MRDPGEMTAEERRDEIARLLAKGLLRSLGHRIRSDSPLMGDPSRRSTTRVSSPSEPPVKRDAT